jgi:hypothetical protein
MPSVAQADLVERVSYISSATKAKEEGGYVDAKTPDLGDIEGGALRAGGRPNVWGRDYIGLLVQYAVVGIVYGTLPATVYPVLQNYLNMEGTQIVSAKVLLNLPWSFKVLYGLLTDCLPIFGYRRRPFMMIGWTLCLLMCLIMACSKIGRPYYLDRSLRDKDVKEYTADDIAHGINAAAPDAGGKFIILMMLAAVGYVGADVACDAVTVELAQREPEAVRGTTQTTIYLVRTVFVALSNLLTGFLFNGKDYGGDFDFSLTFPQLMLILTICTLPALPFGWFFIKEDRHPGVNFKNYISEFWELIQSRAMYQVIAYKFFSGMFENLTQTVSSPVESYWVKATPINDTIATVLSNIIFALVLFCTGKWGLNWNWRWMHAITLICTTLIDAFTTQLVTWNVIRSQWFWLGPPLLENLPYGVGWMIANFVMVELAGEGNEGAVYGLMTTVANLSSTFASTITKNIDSQFDVTSKDIKTDTHHVRTQVMYCYLIAYAANVVGLMFLPLLPAQKRQTQELKAKGGKSKVIGAITVFYLVFALCWSLMVNIMSIYPSTKCLRIVGGTGCHKKTN